MALLFLASLFWGTQASAQSGMLDHEFRSRYSEGLLALRFGGGINRYLGDFRPVDDSRTFALSAMYSIRPFLSAGIRVDYGIASYYREPGLVDQQLYDFQFDDIAGVTETEYTAFHLALQITPLQFSVFDLYFVAAAGVGVYDADDHSGDIARVRPKADLPGAVSVPFAVGFDVHITSLIALSAELQYTMFFAGDFDAFEEKDLTIDYIKAGGSRPYRPDPTNDNLVMGTVGLKVFLFQNDDYDGDLLTNRSEEALGSDPYDIDSDGDGLSDYEEVQFTRSNALQRDSDLDRLNDYEEVDVFRTATMARDTDGDGLVDFEEIYRHGTNPRAADTDSDGLSDKEELDIGTDPAYPDTDLDGMSDADEMRMYKTNPLRADTDEDGVFDYNEVVTYRTDPLLADSDGDGLTDYEEIAFHHSNPNAVDTDGDSLRDDHEIVVTRTDPLDRDTDSDGIWDGVDQCPLVPENYNGIADKDGCPDGIGYPAPPPLAQGDGGRGTGPGTGEGDGGRGTGPGTGEGDGGRGTGPGTGEGDGGRGTGPGTGEGDGGRGTGPGTGAGDGGRGTGPGTGAGDGGRGTGPGTGAGDGGRGTGPGTGAGDGGRGTGPGTGEGDGGRGTGPGTGEGDGGRGTGPGTGEGEGGRGTGPGTGEGEGGRGTGPGTGEGDGGRGSGVGTGEGERSLWNLYPRDREGPLPPPMFARFYEYDPRNVQHIVPLERDARVAATMPVYDFTVLTMRNPQPGFAAEGLEEGKTFILSEMLFAFDSDIILDEYLNNLREKTAVFHEWPELVVEVRGHTDDAGTDTYNDNLSMRRALAVKNFFVRQGIAPARIRAKGFGKSRPLTANNTEAGRALNRRVEMHIITLGTRRSR